MARYEFYQDDKCTLWHRTYYTGEAPSQKETYALAATITITEKTWDDDIQVEGSEFLFDTLEPMTPDENDRQPTAELYTVDEPLIADDLRGPVWEAWWNERTETEKLHIAPCGQHGRADDVEACNEWWQALSGAEKIERWSAETIQE